MLGRQMQVLEALLRARHFLERYPIPDPTPGFARTIRELSDTIDRITHGGSHQILGDNLFQAGTKRVYDKVRILRDRHMRPIATIARAGEDRFPGVDLALRMPHRRIAIERLLAAARAMRQAAVNHADYMKECGRPDDFLERLDSAIEDLLAAERQRTKARHLGIGATAGLRMHLRHARRILAIVECEVLATWEGDAVKLAEWRAAKRVQHKPGPARGATPITTESTAPLEAPPVLPPPLQLVDAA